MGRRLTGRLSKRTRSWGAALLLGAFRGGLDRIHRRKCTEYEDELAHRRVKQLREARRVGPGRREVNRTNSVTGRGAKPPNPAEDSPPSAGAAQESPERQAFLVLRRIRRQRTRLRRGLGLDRG